VTELVKLTLANQYGRDRLSVKSWCDMTIRSVAADALGPHKALHCPPIHGCQTTVKSHSERCTKSELFKKLVKLIFTFLDLRHTFAGAQLDLLKESAHQRCANNNKNILGDTHGYS